VLVSHSMIASRGKSGLFGSLAISMIASAAMTAGCGGGTTPDPTTSMIKVRETPPCAGAGTICTLAGNGDPAFTGEGQPARATSLYWPMDLEIAPDGRPYILDWQNHRVRRLDADGTLHTVIGTDSIGDGPGPGDGNETVAPGIAGTLINLNHPTDLQFSADGATMYLAAWHNHKIRKLDVASGFVEVACGKGPGFAGDGATEDKALFNMPRSIALAPSGDLFVVDTRNFRVRRIAASGTVDTVAGAGVRGALGDGGDRLAATFSFQKDGDNPEPGGAVALDAQGRLYVADTQNNRVLRIDLGSGLVTRVAGDGTFGGGGDGGPAVSAQLGQPQDLEIGPDGRLFIADTENHVVRAVDLATGVINRVAGNGDVGDGGDGGEARAASLNRPFGIALDPAGNLYIADTRNNLVRKVVTP
jgi:DNA-binding beta-propeller fold protein YncE